MMKRVQREEYRQCRAGFALVETMIALVILAVALLTLAMVPLMTSKVGIQTARRERATALAVQTLDVLEAGAANEAVDRSEVVSGDYTILSVKPAYGAANYRAAVTVTWGGVTGATSLTMERDLSKFSDLTRGTK
ncbi:MAG TPA: hypothetical protein DIC53_08030 [Synergistaceae bacterium]|jgi:prepilin-type N-terminal cleavage/methylation domain-containing protein|nr:hypothetical protein [Synergistaceae bacterium]